MTGLCRDQLEKPRWSVMLRRERTRPEKITAAESLKRVSVRGTHTQTVLTGLFTAVSERVQDSNLSKNVDMFNCLKVIGHI